MKKCIVVYSLILFSSALSFGFDPFNDHLYEFGYQYNSESPFGFYAGYAGFFLAFNLPDIIFDDSESSENASRVDEPALSQFTLGYSFKLTNWLYLPLGIAIWNDVVDADSNTVSMDTYGFVIGLEFDLNINVFSLQFKVSTLNFNKLFLGVGAALKGRAFSGGGGNRSGGSGGGSGGNGGSSGGGGGGGNNGGGSGRQDGGRDYFSFTP